MSLINGKTNTVTDTIKVGESPWAISVNPSTNMVYVANFYGDTVSARCGNVVENVLRQSHEYEFSLQPLVVRRVHTRFGGVVYSFAISFISTDRGAIGYYVRL